jgi:hypothetical protein
MANVMQHCVKFCSELGKSGFGSTCSVANRFGKEALPFRMARYQWKMQAELANKECCRKLEKIR